MSERDYSRRAFLRTACAVPAALALATQGGCAPSSTRKPNVIFILADDLGYGDLGAYGQEKISTPNLDRLAAQGMKFTDHYAGSPVCAPSRSTLVTGQHTGHTTVRHNFGRTEDTERGRIPLQEEDVTIGEVFKEGGYATGCIGKWGLGEPGTTGVPNEQGFDYWFGYLNQKNAHSYYPPYLWRNKEKVVLEGNENGGREQYTHDLFTEEALGFIERHQEEPFFLYLPYTIPHIDLLVPEDSMEPYRGQFPDVPYKDDVYEQPAPLTAYAGMVSRLDRDVGRLMQLLSELGLEEDTLVLFSSDNGPHDKDGNDPEFFDSNGPFKGIKRDVYEGGIRVPLIARWPGTIAEGTVSNHVSAFWDFLPTAAEIAGVSAPGGIDGISYLPTLLGESQQQHEYLYWEYVRRGQVRQAVRMRRWKGVRYGLDSPIEVYNLEADPGETNNLADTHPEIVDEVAACFETAHSESPWFPFPSEAA